MTILIIQTSPTHTASTLLVNALYGLIPELNDKKIMGNGLKIGKKNTKITLKM